MLRITHFSSFPYPPSKLKFLYFLLHTILDLDYFFYTSIACFIILYYTQYISYCTQKEATQCLSDTLFRAKNDTRFLLKRHGGRNRRFLRYTVIFCFFSRFFKTVSPALRPRNGLFNLYKQRKAVRELSLGPCFRRGKVYRNSLGRAGTCLPL